MENIKNYYSLKLRELPSENKPREKISIHGPAALKNYELLSIILGRGNRNEDVFMISHRIIAEYGNKAIINETSVSKLQALTSIGTVHACQVIACFELGRRFFGKARHDIYLRTPDDVYAYLSDMQKHNKEHLRGLYLDIKNKLIHDEIISIGTLTENLVHPREIFNPAIHHSAAGIIISHNHPSGDPTPSEDDVKVTKKLLAASDVLGIELLDHIIVGDKVCVSMKKIGLF
ncbi:MAG: DNA repair protein RadC [Elusimicrobiota bacterium]